MRPIERFPTFTPKEFALLGLQDIAYVKRIIVNDAPAFAVCAADGTQIAVLSDYQVALAAVRQQELEPLSVH
jgi:hypothetical protein